MAGTGWTNTAGTAGETAIAASTEGQSLTNYKKVHFLQPSHTHDFTYSASGATITATCGAANCGLTSNPTLTIVKPTLTTYGQTGDGISAAATLDGVADFNTATGLSVADTAIKYYKATKGEGDAYTKGDEITTGAPTGAGVYMAEITLTGVKIGAETTGDVAASVGYTIAPITISTVAVTEITAPVATETLDTEAATTTEHVALGSESAITWDPAAPEDGKAAYATTYKATVTAAADANYAFDENVTATVNGQEATVTKNQDGTLSIAYTFEKTDLTPVTITPTNKEADWSAEGIAIPVEGMFTITEGAGDATYSVENGTGEGSYDAQTGKLTVTKCGTFTVKVSTAATDTYAAGAETAATLTVNKVDSAAATVTANSRTYDGTEKPLVTVTGEATGGTMQYALGTDTEATEPYTTSIPAKTEAGTYYVWYKAVGDANHNDTEPAVLSVTISPVDKTELNALIASVGQYCDSIKEGYKAIADALKTVIDAARAVAANINAAPGEIADAISKLSKALETARSAVEAAKDQAAAQAVSDQINALPASVSLSDREAVAAARAAYDKLTDAQKALVPAETLKKLTDAEAAIAAEDKAAADAQRDAAAAQAVSDQINALPASVSLSDREAVAAARAAYDALSDAQKALVPAETLKKLTDAEATIAAEAAKISIAKCAITAKDRIYTGKAIVPKVTVMYGETKLKEGRDYTLSYKKAKDYQKVWVTVKGKGQFEGKKKVSFKIIPKGTSLTRATGGKKTISLKWRKRDGVRGYYIQYSLNEDFSRGNEIYVKGVNNLSMTVRKLKPGRTYYVRVRTYVKRNNRIFFSAWSEAKTVKTKGAAANGAEVIEIPLYVGDELNLASLAAGVDGWKSSDEAVATVSAEGIVKALAAGQAEVTGQTADGEQVTIVITVSEGEVLELGELEPNGLDGLSLDEIYGDAPMDEEIELTIEQ